MTTYVETVDTSTLLETGKMLENLVLRRVSSLRCFCLFCPLSKRRCFAPQLLYASTGVLGTRAVVSAGQGSVPVAQNMLTWKFFA